MEVRKSAIAFLFIIGVFVLWELAIFTENTRQKISDTRFATAMLSLDASIRQALDAVYLKDGFYAPSLHELSLNYDDGASAYMLDRFHYRVDEQFYEYHFFCPPNLYFSRTATGGMQSILNRVQYNQN